MFLTCISSVSFISGCGFLFFCDTFPKGECQCRRYWAGILPSFAVRIQSKLTERCQVSSPFFSSYDSEVTSIIRPFSSLERLYSTNFSGQKAVLHRHHVGLPYPAIVIPDWVYRSLGYVSCVTSPLALRIIQCYMEAALLMLHCRMSEAEYKGPHRSTMSDCLDISPWAEYNTNTPEMAIYLLLCSAILTLIAFLCSVTVRYNSPISLSERNLSFRQHRIRRSPSSSGAHILS